MESLNNRYVKVFTYRGFDICTLKSACPTEGEGLGYIINDKQFAGQEFNLIDDAIKAIEEKNKTSRQERV